MHEFYIEGVDGDIDDIVPFCSDFCHRAWCEAEGETYEGWNGCHEGADYDQECAHCGELLPGIGE